MPPSAPRRDAILAAAARLFAERVFHGVGVDDIGAAVGISGPGIYRHFPSKDAMLGEMLVGISRRLLSEASERAGATTDPRARLDSLIRWHIDFALGNPELITVQDRDLASLPEPDRGKVRRLQRRYVELWVGVLAELQPAAAEPRLRASAHAVFGLLNSTPYSALGLDPDAVAELLRGMALGALGVTNRRPRAAAATPR